MCNGHFAADKIEYLFLILIFLDMPEDALISKIEILFANTKSLDVTFLKFEMSS
jgi:hypothetical protein